MLRFREVSARKMGIVDSPDGTLRFEPSEAEKPSNSENGLAAVRTACDKTSQSPLVEVADKELATNYSFLLMSQMTSCTFAESDRLGKRRSHRLGFPGLACVHCFSSNGSGRYFPSSVKTFADVSKTRESVLLRFVFPLAFNPPSPSPPKRRERGVTG